MQVCLKRYCVNLKQVFIYLHFFKHSVPILLRRKLTGSIVQRSAVLPKPCDRFQLLYRTLGHRSAVSHVLFDQTGRYIFTVCWSLRFVMAEIALRVA